jgi:enoyl-CoA hydratase
VPGLTIERSQLANGTVEVLTLDRPHRLNAIDQQTLAELERHVGALATDAEVRAVVLTGAGDRAFCAGADVREFGGIEPIDAEAIMARGQEILGAMERLPQPVIAAINGYALGGGLEVALACDFRIAATSARLGQPEISLGHIPGWGATQRLARIVGEGNARNLILRGHLIEAAEALRIGLLHDTCEPGELLDRALALCDELAAHPPTALALAKRAILASRAGDASGYVLERQAVALCFSTPVQQAAIERFINRDAGGREAAPA